MEKGNKFLKYIVNKGGGSIKKKAIAGFFILQEFSQWRLWGKKKDRLALHDLFTEARRDEKSDGAALKKSARLSHHAGRFDIYGVERGLFLYMFRHLAGKHVLLEVTHGPARFIFITGRAFFFLVGSLLNLVDGILSSGYPGADEVQRPGL
jgi:hypothetical protein